MKCPVCVQKDLKSNVYPEGGTSTCMMGTQYYDEDGKWHDHDPNESSDTYHCFRGHRFMVSTRKGCPGCGTEDKRTFYVL